MFFPPGNQTTALLNAFVNYAAGFLVRPFGALFFGRIGDLVGRKYTFLVTITVMGLSTFLVGCLPTYSTIGMLAPPAPAPAPAGAGPRPRRRVRRRGDLRRRARAGGQARGHTAWIQTTATLGLFLALVVICICREHDERRTTSRGWGWRIPFLLSIILLGISIYIRLKLNESPMFRKMKEEGKGSKAPLSESFGQWGNLKIVILALLGATAGQGVVWYTGQFYALFFLQTTLKVPFETVYLLIAASLVIGTPFFIVFGRLSDRIGRKWIMMLGCLLGVLTYFPLFKATDPLRQPGSGEFNAANKVTPDRNRLPGAHLRLPTTQYSDCDRVRNMLTSRSVSYNNIEAAARARLRS